MSTLKSRITRPDDIATLTGGSLVGEYEIEAQIGEGAMGTVYAATQPVIGKRVAIKVLKAELCANQGQLDRFVAEAQAVNTIAHPNIVDVFSLGELPDGRAYLVMEWLRGEDLGVRIARGPLAAAETCAILAPIARALRAAHAQQIVHRDLKPDNVFLVAGEHVARTVKLLDFGIAKLARTDAASSRTNTGDMLGTPCYISPEQARGIDVDGRADIYSLGVMAYEMLTGAPPFTGASAMDLVIAHLNQAPPPLGAGVPRPLAQLVMAMLAKAAADRPTLEQVLAVVEAPLAVRAAAAPRAAWLVAGGVAVLAVVALGVTFAHGEAAPRPVAAPIEMPVIATPPPVPVAVPPPIAAPPPAVAAPVAVPTVVIEAPKPKSPRTATATPAKPAKPPPPPPKPVDDDIMDPRAGRTP